MSAEDQEVHLMKPRRTVLILLMLTSLTALFASACCWPYYHRGGRGGHRLASVELKVDAAPAAQAGVAAR
jgi:hypothetical protein